MVVGVNTQVGHPAPTGRQEREREWVNVVASRCRPVHPRAGDDQQVDSSTTTAGLVTSSMIVWVDGFSISFASSEQFRAFTNATLL
eukprot:13013837-Alexandrium_andersonii.AAC.1